MAVLVVTGDVTALLPAVLASGSAFIASNLDDIVLLLLFFATAQTNQERWQIVFGQYLGFTVLVLASLGGCIGGRLLASEWVGLLGLIPISLGVSRLVALMDRRGEEGPIVDAITAAREPRSSLDALAIAALTIANGGDNIGIYLPLLSRASSTQLLACLVVFAVMVAGWCLVAFRLVQSPSMAGFVRQYLMPLIPFILIALGFLILVDSKIFLQRNLSTIVLVALVAMVIHLMRQFQSVHASSLPFTSSAKPCP